MPEVRDTVGKGGGGGRAQVRSRAGTGGVPAASAPFSITAVVAQTGIYADDTFLHNLNRHTTHTHTNEPKRNWENLNKISGLYRCQYLGFDIIL